MLEAVGSDVRHVGPSGAGSAAKLANQLMMFRQRESSKQIPDTLLEHLITIKTSPNKRLTTAGRRTR